MLYLNDVLEHKESGNRLRVVHLNYAEEEIWLFGLAEKNAFPKLYELGFVENELATGALSEVRGGSTALTIITPSKAAIAHRDQAYSRIEPLKSNLDILIPAKRYALVTARAKELECSPQTIYQCLRNWWRNGQSLNALLPQFDTRGSTAGTTANRGRRAKYLDRSNFQITANDYDIIEKALKRLYLKSDIMTLAGCYQRVLEQSYSYVDGEGQRYLKAPGEYPSEQQFRWLAKKLLPEEMTIRKRKGNAKFELDHRAKLGSLQHETYTVGDVFEIDATIVDIFIVSSRNRAIIIGKPTLYLIIDRKSWLIVGFYVGIENASWPAAMQAIKSISEDKAALCKRYGQPYKITDWVADGVYPKEFVADRGAEMLYGSSSQLAEELKIIVRNLPAKRADHKPLVECGFKLLQRSMADSVLGYAPPENFAKRQGKHYEQDACLNLHEITSTILAAIIRFNRSPRPDYNLAAENVLNGFQPIPVDIWNLEIRQRAGALARVPEEQVRFALLPRAEATVTREGIRLGHCYYSCPEAISRGWIVAAGRGAFPVSVSYDRRLVDSIYIHDDKNPTRFFVATLLDKCSDYRGLSFQEVEAIEYLRKANRQQGHQITRQNQLEFHQKMDPVVKKAHAEMKALSKGKSRTARKKDVVQDRVVERRLERQTEARIPRTAPANVTSAEVVQFVPRQAAPTKPDTTSTTPAVSDQDARRRQKYLDMLNGK